MTTDPELQRQRQEWREQEEYEEKSWREQQEEREQEEWEAIVGGLPKKQGPTYKKPDDTNTQKIKPEDLPF